MYDTTMTREFNTHDETRKWEGNVLCYMIIEMMCSNILYDYDYEMVLLRHTIVQCIME